MDSLKVLILAGGHSSRMGSPKHLLALSSGPLYFQLIMVLHEALPKTNTMYISIADRSVLDETLRNGIIPLASAMNPCSTSIKLKKISDNPDQDIGPVAGLLSAYHYDTEATWLIIACDYPLLQAAAVHQLIENYDAPVTCFKNANGFSEPLLGIWSPNALRSLQDNVGSNHTGPAYTLRQLGSKLIVPNREEWLVNVNTRQEWEAAKARLEQIQSKKGT